MRLETIPVHMIACSTNVWDDEGESLPLIVRTRLSSLTSWSAFALEDKVFEDGMLNSQLQAAPTGWQTFLTLLWALCDHSSSHSLPKTWSRHCFGANLQLLCESSERFHDKIHDFSLWSSYMMILLTSYFQKLGHDTAFRGNYVVRNSRGLASDPVSRLISKHQRCWFLEKIESVCGVWHQRWNYLWFQ